MKKIKRFKIKSYSRISGNLKPLNFNKKFPINVKRIFFIYGKKNKIRGEHAHKKCYQFFIPISGKMILNIQTPNSKKKIKLEDMSKTAILVPPKYWCSIKFIRKNSILMVACNRYYEPNDYIENFDVYKKYLSKK
jgi:dTDP-4-dehydrorhamnose 3,5-epimerase-like enzyme|tara:strand:- start:824 stop:1228 length:405 start_codon:yes stop_codon:yes gene_type:complete